MDGVVVATTSVIGLVLWPTIKADAKRPSPAIILTISYNFNFNSGAQTR